ncbi:MAG: hypothetical protein ACUVQM_06545 [Candidatus Hadarchaeaceae archaeon]
MVSTGKIHQALEGCACPMGAVSREFLKKFKTLDNEVLLVDMEAGIKHFGRGLETGVDGVISVVEPLLESISLAKKVMDLTQSAGAVFYGAVLNKATSEQQKHKVIMKLKEHGILVIGSIGFYETTQVSCPEEKPLVDEMASAKIKDLTSKLLQRAKEKKDEVVES